MSGLGLTFLRRGGQAHPSAGSDYIRFEDPEVFDILMANGVSSDGVGITMDDMSRVTSISNWFVGNTAIVSFNELRYTSMTIIGAPSYSTQNGLSGCTGLKAVSIPDVVTRLGNLAFQGCSSLENLSCNWDLITSIDEAALYNCSPSIGPLTLQNVTAVAKNAFRNSNGITELVFENLSAFGLNACREMTALTRVIIRGTIQSFPTSSYGWDSGVFYGCSALEFADLSDSVTSAPSVFISCPNLETVIFRSVNPPTITTNTFSGCSALDNIYVPDASVDAYKAASVWSSYAAKIKGLSEYQG